jgi:hypothetical protein
MGATAAISDHLRKAASRAAMLIGTEVMAAKLEVIMDPAVSGKKARRVTR